jgi:hypothetical protein
LPTCDFCGEVCAVHGSRTWRHESFVITDTALLDTLHHPAGEVIACRMCRPFVERRDLKGIVERALGVNPPWRAQLEFLRSVHAGFLRSLVETQARAS